MALVTPPLVTTQQPASATAKPSSPMAAGDIGSIFFGMMGTPFQSETVTSLFRMVDAALRQQRNVTVWTCGHATGLSQTSMVRPPDLFLPDQAAGPTTADLIRSLMRKHPGRLDWLVCRYCMEERGNTQQIAEASIKIPFSFQHYLSAADIALVLGVKA